MEPDTLFDNPVEMFHGRKSYSMPLYEYVARSDREHAKHCRQLLNQIFRECHLSNEAKREIRSRFRSKANGNHLGALFELFVYSLFDRSGYIIESALRTVSGKPDFKVQSPGGEEFYVEATCALGDNAPSEKDRIRCKIHDTVDAIESDNFRVALSIRGQFPARFSKKRLRNEIQAWLDTLDYQEILQRNKSDRPAAAVEEERFGIGAGSLVLRAIAIDPPTSSRHHGFVMLGPAGELERVITDQYIHRKLKYKARQLKGCDLPALLVVNVLEPFMDDDDILTAIFGPLNTVIPSGAISIESARFRREMNGAWIHSGKPQNRSVEAVLLMTNVGHDCIPSKEPKLIMNPYVGTSRLPMNIPFCRYRIPSLDGLRLLDLANSDADSDRTRNGWMGRWPLP